MVGGDFMLTGATSKRTIEYFLLMHEQPDVDRLVYYDPTGVRYEANIAREMLDEALKIFDGKRKAIKRSSGGLVHADPYQLVIFEDKDSGAAPEIRVKVKFKEFKKDAEGKFVVDEYVMNHKVVPVSEISDPFTFALDGQQRFVLDFGQGMIPVYVFHYDTDANGTAMAYFTEIDALRRALTGKVGEYMPVQTYKVPRDILRFACDLTANGSSEYLEAMDNQTRLKENGISIIPDSLLVFDRIDVCFPQTHQGFRKYLRQRLGFKNSENTATTIKMKLPNSENVEGENLWRREGPKPIAVANSFNAEDGEEKEELYPINESRD
jgi:hypothetical protein